MTSVDIELKQLFDNLQKWQKFPKYQLERRLDIFFTIYLKEIIEGCLGKPVLDWIIPEFPILISKFPDEKEVGEKETLHSCNIDYVMFTEDKGILLIELKTDMNSKGVKQEKRMQAVKDQLNDGSVRFDNLIKHIEDIKEGSHQKPKYEALLTLLNEQKLNGHRDAEKNSAEIIYIQPEPEKKPYQVIDFKTIVKLLEKDTSNHTILRSLFANILSEIHKTS